MRATTFCPCADRQGQCLHRPQPFVASSEGHEVYRDRLILYGSGDFLNDYEGIKGYEEFRDDLVLMCFADIQPVGNLGALKIVPLQIRNFHLIHPSKQDIYWMQQTLDRESRKFGVGFALNPDGRFTLS